jgi:N-acetylglucosamine kinase-like BadF-type ATPase
LLDRPPTPDPRPLFVGIDLGGSGTRAALVDAEGNLLATGQGISSGHLSGAAGRRQLGRALDGALASIAPLIAREQCVIHAGTRGLSIPGRRESLSLELSMRFPTAQAHISNDALIALWGGLAGRAGVAVLAGTGSIALARSSDGREGRAGGWGYLLGDEGSGYWLGREAIAVLLRALEGRDSTGALVDLVRAAPGRGVQSVPAVIAWVNSGSGQVMRLASLAPLVAQAADAGDPLAAEILCRGARALAEITAAAARQVWPNASLDPLDVACCGGVWAAGPRLMDHFAAALADMLPGSRPTPALLPPVGGAVLLAMGSATRPLAGHAVERVIQAVEHGRGAQ